MSSCSSKSHAPKSAPSFITMFCVSSHVARKTRSRFSATRQLDRADLCVRRPSATSASCVCDLTCRTRAWRRARSSAAAASAARRAASAERRAVRRPSPAATGNEHVAAKGNARSSSLASASAPPAARAAATTRWFSRSVKTSFTSNVSTLSTRNVRGSRSGEGASRASFRASDGSAASVDGFSFRKDFERRFADAPSDDRVPSAGATGSDASSSASVCTSTAPAKHTTVLGEVGEVSFSVSFSAIPAASREPAGGGLDVAADATSARRGRVSPPGSSTRASPRARRARTPPR